MADRFDDIQQHPYRIWHTEEYQRAQRDHEAFELLGDRALVLNDRERKRSILRKMKKHERVFSQATMLVRRMYHSAGPERAKLMQRVQESEDERARVLADLHRDLIRLE